MESTIGLYKTELIDRHRSFTGRTDPEHATAEWVHWYTTSRLHSALGHRTPLKHEQHYHHHTAALTEAPRTERLHPLQDGSLAHGRI